MNWCRTLLCVMLFVALSSCGFAAVLSENAAISKGDDPRLDQSVTYDADGIPISTVLDQLAGSTGVVMNAGLDENDWMVRDRKVVVHVKDMKLVDLMREFAGILRFHWSRGGEEGKWTYRLWQDGQHRTEEESLRASATDTQSKESRQRRENALADMVNLGSLSANDAAGLEATDPWRYVLATEPLGRDAAEFLNGFPAARNAFVQGIEVSFPVFQLSSQLQATVRRIAESYDSLTQKIGISENHSRLLEEFDRLQITINRRRAGSGDDVVSKSMLGRLTVGGQELFDIPVFDPGSPVAKALGKAIIALKSGTPRETVETQLKDDMEAAAGAKDVVRTLARDISSDPALRAKIKLFDLLYDDKTLKLVSPSRTAPLPVVLRALAENAKLNVISDYFLGENPAIAAGEKTLGEQLEAISAAYGVNWEKAGRTVRFRDKEWFVKRWWEVPEVWVRYWTERGRINGGLQLLDLVQIGNLRDEQIDHTIMSDSALVRVGAGDAARNRQILRFYGSLKDEQVQKLITDHLSVSSLTDAQWAALQDALATKGAAYAAAARGSQFIQLSQTGTNAIEYKFAYYPGDNAPPVTFVFQSGMVYKTADELPVPAPPKAGN